MFQRFRSFAWIASICLFVALMAVRGEMLFEITRDVAGCPVCVGLTSMQQDASLLALLLGFVGLSLLFTRYWLQLPWLLLAALLTTVFATDIVVTKTLAQRLYLFDVIKFGKEFRAIGEFGGIFLVSAAGKMALLVALAGSAVVVASLLPRSRNPRFATFCFVAAVVLAAIGRWQPISMKYIHYELLQNVVAANLDLGVDRPYSTVFATTLAERYTPPEPICRAGPGLRPNIIVLAVESLSMHQSQLFGGFRDLTPRLDAIARDHSYIPDFIANGFTTDGGEIAMITGQAPIPTIGRYQSADAFSGYTDPQGAVPDRLRPYGYTTHFFTTADLGFLDKTKWFSGLRFDSWEGAEQPFYTGWKRRHFNAAEDKALYLRFLQWLDARKGNDPPFFSFLMTVSTHPPFINPTTDLPDEAGAFGYADEQIGLFYDELKKRDFFRNGILMIAGDHRSMTPLLPAEQARFGDSALARTPFVVVTDLPIVHGAIPGTFQQADIPTSVADMVATKSCLTPFQGSFLRVPAEPAEYIAHARGDKRNEVDIFFDRQQAQIVLDGDQSHWEGPRPANWQSIQDHILLDRIRRGSVDENLLDLLIELHRPAAAAHALPDKPN